MSSKNKSLKAKPSSKFVLENINTNNLEKKYVMNEDMLMSSLRNSPKSKKTKIKDIFSKMDKKEFEVKEVKHYIKETENINFYISMNGEMVSKQDLEKNPIRCFHCHQSLNCVPLTVPIRYHNSVIIESYTRSNKFFEEETINTQTCITVCMSNKDKNHKNCVKKDFFEGIGVVCSFECAIGHSKMRLLCGDNRFKESYVLLAKMYFKMYKKMMPRLEERPMFSYELTKDYGGMCETIPKNITECRNTENCLSNTDLPIFKVSSSIYQELKK